MSLILVNYKQSSKGLYVYIDVEGSFWFRSDDIADIISPLTEYTENYIHWLDKLEWTANEDSCESLPDNWQRTTTFVSEAALYQLMLCASKRCARLFAFSKWVTVNLLPFLRSNFLSPSPLLDVATLREGGYVYVASTNLLEKECIYYIGSATDVYASLVALNRGRTHSDELYCMHSKYVDDHRRVLKRICAALDEYRPSKEHQFFYVPSLYDILHEIELQICEIK